MPQNPMMKKRISMADRIKPSATPLKKLTDSSFMSSQKVDDLDLMGKNTVKSAVEKYVRDRAMKSKLIR